MKELESFLDKVLGEKLKEKEAILKEAQAKREELVSKFRKEAQIYFKEYEEKEKAKIEAQIREAFFKTKLEKKRKVLEEKSALKKEILERLRAYLSKNPEFIPKKKIISHHKIEETPLEIEEFLDLVMKKASQKLEEILDGKV